MIIALGLVITLVGALAIALLARLDEPAPIEPPSTLTTRRR